jgi:hypothetical protein
MGEHRGDKPWFTLATKVTLEWFPDREAALEAEERAIKREHPVYNVQHNVHVEIDFSISPEAMARNLNMLAALACGAVLAIRWAADAGSFWWQQHRAAAEGRFIEVLPPRNPFTQDPPPTALVLMMFFLKEAFSPTPRQPAGITAPVAAEVLPPAAD